MGVDGVDHEVKQALALGFKLFLGHVFVFLPKDIIYKVIWQFYYYNTLSRFFNTPAAEVGKS